MLYWICPECGQECSPAIRECPTCTAAEKAAPIRASQDLLSLAQSFQSAPAGPAVITAAAPASSQPAKPAVSPVAPPLAAPVLVAAKKPPRAEFCLKLAGLAPAGKIIFHPAPLRLAAAHQQPVEPAPSRRRSVAFVRKALPGVNTSGLALADFAPPSAVRLTSSQAGNHTGHEIATEISLAPIGPKVGCVAYIASRLQLAGESLTDLLRALERSAEELECAAIRAIQASFQDHPPELLLCAAPEIVAAPAPPAEQWLRSPRLVFTAQAPGNAAPATLTAGPQPPTLAGPCLPPDLRNLTRSRNWNQRPAGKRTSAPAWILRALVALGVLLGAGSLFQYIASNRDARAASIAPEPARTIQPAPAPPLPVAEGHPGAKFVEVAGLRVITAPNRKPQLQYLVINHSAAELTGLNIHIAARAADSPAGAPLFRVSSIVPSLAAYQSKEVRTDLDAGLSAASIPDWQSLRTEILIARQ